MPMFRVELDRRLFPPGEKPRNPFLGGIPAIGSTHEVSVRAWEFEAEDEAEVRQLLREAQKKDVPGVRGYSLRSITQLPQKADEPQNNVAVKCSDCQFAGVASRWGGKCPVCHGKLVPQ